MANNNRVVIMKKHTFILISSLCITPILQGCDKITSEQSSEAWQASFRVSSGELTTTELEKATWVRVEAWRNGTLLAYGEAAYSVHKATLTIPSAGAVDIKLIGYANSSKSTVMWTGSGSVSNGTSKPGTGIVTLAKGPGLLGDSTSASTMIPWNSKIFYDSIVDSRDNQAYKIVTIGTQTWMAQNLNYKSTSSSDSSWCLNDSQDSCKKYGRLYNIRGAIRMNLNAIFDSLSLNRDYSNSDSSWDYYNNVTPVLSMLAHQGACPVGWRVPLISDWRALAMHIGIDTNQTELENLSGSSIGTKLRSTSGWVGKTAGTDDYGFRVLPAGEWWDTKYYDNWASFWTLRERMFDANALYNIEFSSIFTGIEQELSTHTNRSSIRCIKNQIHSIDGLANLVIDSTQGTLTPKFNSALHSYTATVNDTTSTITITSTPSNTISEVRYSTNGGLFYNSNSIPTFRGTTNVAIRVRDADGNSSTYNIAIQRKETPWNLNVQYGTLLDSRDQQAYKTIQIGNMQWMAQNLNYTIDSSWCPTSLVGACSEYGRVYTWASSMALNDSCNNSLCAAQIQQQHKGICPTGWHIPNDSEWNAMFAATGSPYTGSGYNGLALWSQEGSGTDDFGFRILSAPNTSGLPTNINIRTISSFFPWEGGYRNVTFQSSAESSASELKLPFFQSGNKFYQFIKSAKSSPTSIRCTKDK